MSTSSPKFNARFRFWNRVVYNTLPNVYAGMDWITFGAWWRLVRRALAFVPPDQRVLEVGFGPGKLLAELTRQSKLAVGIDLAWGMCRYTSDRLQSARLPARVMQGSAFMLPYPDETFDTVTSTFVVSGLPESEKALAEMARVTRYGGQVVLVDIGLPQDNNWLGTTLARLWESAGDYLYDIPALMTTVGLKVVTFEEYGPGTHIRLVVGEKEHQ